MLSVSRCFCSACLFLVVRCLTSPRLVSLCALHLNQAATRSCCTGIFQPAFLHTLFTLSCIFKKYRAGYIYILHSFTMSVGLGLFKCIKYESMNIVSFDSECQNTDILGHNKHEATGGGGVFRSTPATETRPTGSGRLDRV